METWLRKTTTREIERATMGLVMEYRHGYEKTEENDFPDKIQQAIDCQKNIGLFPFICGIFESDWTTLQNKHFQKVGSRRCATQWAA